MTPEELKKYKEELKKEYGNTICESGCCDGWSSSVDEVTGKCPDCGGPVVEGGSASGCNYSPVDCKTCGSSPCDQYC